MLPDFARSYFEARFQPADSGCWIWTGPSRHGYGEANLANRKLRAHRVSFEIHKGPIPDGLTIDHLCFVPLCVNPAHLVLATVSENARRQRSALKPACIHGHEFTPENTIYRKPGREGLRRCRACNNWRVRQYKARLRKARLTA